MRFIKKLLKFIRRVLHGEVLREINHLESEFQYIKSDITVLNSDVMRVLHDEVLCKINHLESEFQHIKSDIAKQQNNFTSQFINLADQLMYSINLQDHSINLQDHFINLQDHSINLQELSIEHINYINSLLENNNKEFNGFVNTFFSFDDMKSTAKTREMHAVIGYMLRNMKKICDKLGVRFWLHGGTLLGAARHGGFVPWDDDADLGMMRSDLKKLEEYLKNHDEFEVRYFFHPAELQAVQAKFVFKDRSIPLFLDIFAYDHCDYSKKDEVWRAYMNERKFLKQQIIDTGIKENDLWQLKNKDEEAVIMKLISNSIQKFSICAEKTGIVFGVEHFTANFERIYCNDFIFPLKTLKFDGVEYFVPNHYEDYLYRQYGDWQRIPKDAGVQKHMKGFTAEHFSNIRDIYKEIIKDKKQILGYTAGAFDMFHIGHLNLLQKARENCDRLIVGITTDELVMKTKNKLPIIPFEERAAIVHACGYVDEVVAQDDLNKINAWEKLHYDVLFSGDDWKGNPRWAGYEKELEKVGVKIKYFPYTDNTSSSKLANIIKEYQE